ncbi:MAG: hypothetical protein ACLUKO_11485 [Enterocloster bolteae]
MNEDERSVWVRDFRWNTYENQQTAKLLASDLEYALSKGALELYYQPQVKRDGTSMDARHCCVGITWARALCIRPLSLRWLSRGFHRNSGHVYCREGLP